MCLCAIMFSAVRMCLDTQGQYLQGKSAPLSKTRIERPMYRLLISARLLAEEKSGPVSSMT